jgi:hypothetical protein
MAHAYDDSDTYEDDAEHCAQIATAKLAERDKMFPWPVELSKVERDCETYKHEHVSWGKPPCLACGGEPMNYLNWEQK